MSPTVLRASRWVATALVPVAFGLGTIWFQRAGGITMFDDELGFLGEAVSFSSRSGRPLLRGIPFYSTGYPLLLAVPMSLTRFDPWVVAVAVNLVLLGAIGPVLHQLVRRVFPDLAPTPAALAAIAGATVPSVVLQAPRAWSEVSVALGFSVWALLALRWSRLGPVQGAVPFAVASGVMVSLHRRSTVIVAVTLVAIVIWSLLAGWRSADAPVGASPARRLTAALRAVRWVPMLVAVGAGVVTVAAALAVDGRVVDDLYDGVTSGSRLSKADNLTTTRWIPTLLGHVWSQLAVTMGLVGIGVVALGWLLVRRRHVPFALCIGAAYAGVLMTSVTFLAAASARADQLVYERYAAAALPVVVAVGVGWLVSEPRLARRAAALAGVVLVATGGVLSISLEASRLTGGVQKFTVPTLSSLQIPGVGWGVAFPNRIDVSTITAVSAVGLAVIVASGALASRLRTPSPHTTSWVAPAAIVALWAVVMAVGSAGNLKSFVDVWEPTGRDAAALLADHDGDVLLYGPLTRHEARNVLHYRLGYPVTHLVDPISCEQIAEVAGPGVDGLDDPGGPGPYVVGPTDFENDPDLTIVVLVTNIPGVVYDVDC